MALRRRDAAIAWLVAFISWTLVTDWFPTGRLILYAFLTGAIAGLLGLLWLIISTSRGSRHLLGRNEDDGIRNVRTASFVKPSRWGHETKRLRQSLDYKQIKIHEGARNGLNGRNHLLSQRIDSLLSNVQKTYINSWHSKISGRSAFTNEVDFTIRTALISILDRLSAVDIADVAVSQFLPIITAHVRDFANAERAAWGERLSRETLDSDELAKRYRNGRIHHAASLSYSDTQTIQHQHLRNLVLGILPSILPPNMMNSPLVCVLIREVIAGAILLPLMQALVDPDFWNQLIISQGRVFLQERHKVVKLRAALQEHAAFPQKAKRPKYHSKLLAKDSERKFDNFVRRIRSCENSTEARELLSNVVSQIQKEVQADRPDQLYLHRLESGKKLLEQKIERSNTTKPDQSSSKLQNVPTIKPRLAQKDDITLKAILYDASGLSAFMRYMDQLNLISLVKFYLVVDGFCVPSEKDVNRPMSPLTLPWWTETDRLSILQIFNSYLTKPELKVSPNVLKDVERFLKAGVHTSQTDYLAARRSILEAQAMIFSRMQDPLFANFKASDYFSNWLISKDTSALLGLPETRLSYENDTGDGSISNPHNSQNASSRLRAEPSQLRRSTASTSDLKEKFKAEETPRRSLDERGRKPLFDDDYDSDNLASSVQSLNSVDGDMQTSRNQRRIMETMQAELDNIIDGQSDTEALLCKVNRASIQNANANTLGQDETKTSLLHPSNERERPSISSLGLVGEPTRGTVFSDDLFADEEKFVEDEREDSDVDDKNVEDEVHEAHPGDLGLAEAVSTLSDDIERLAAQELIIDSLTNKATLTNNVAELRILRKSKTSLEREIRRKELQRQQYIVQESDNSLYRRATVSIKSVMVANSEDGEEYALYIIEIRRHNRGQTNFASWVVPRRYSEFHSLNKKLKAKYPVVRNLDFPRRQVVLKLQKDFLRKRRLALEKYLQSLLLIAEICSSRELRAFLSQRAIVSSTTAENKSMSSSYSSSATATINTRDFVSRVYNSVTDGMEEFLGNIPVLEQLSMAGQHIISAAAPQLDARVSSSTAVIAKPNSSGNTTAAITATAITAEMQAELNAAENRGPSHDPEFTETGPGNEAKSFIKPICDAFLELFDLDKGNNWLRGRAVVLVLHQLLGGTVERKVRESVRTLLAEEQLLRYLEVVDAMLQPDNGKAQGGGSKNNPRSPAEKTWSKQEAGQILSALVPEVVGNVVGRANAQAASQKFLAVLNNGRLNTHLAYTLLDKMVNILFGKPGSGQAQK